ncbi:MULTISPECIES: hypothetical protein [unclassified Streptomyces]|uniref:hypothetical protein n=1 Tax=unclassified Streptomyces TaxID=2593676 RepID=UPI002E2BC8CB|nr:hypothetical protein [Streptomyces sp. NBC_01439]
MAQLTSQDDLAGLYDHDLEAHFDTGQLREGLAGIVSATELDRITAAVDATGDKTVSYETATTRLKSNG